mmetsp:Transcript_15777/g.28819  ORF Transcript_15777/g.28819 Transcript_15777/m.28819 type:complete len:141 (-) Transcript_15777:1066-1488(-)
MEQDLDLKLTTKKLMTEDGLISTQFESLAEPEDIDPEEELAFPLSRVKKLMSAASSTKIKQDSVKLIIRATELFIEDLTRKAAQVTKSYKKKTVAIGELAEAVDMYSYLEFVKDAGVFRMPYSQDTMNTTQPMEVEEKPC